MKLAIALLYNTLSMQALYEIAVAFGSLTRLFWIYTLRPRAKILYEGNVTDVGEPPLVLVVEENDTGPDIWSASCLHSKLRCVNVFVSYLEHVYTWAMDAL